MLADLGDHIRDSGKMLRMMGLSFYYERGPYLKNLITFCRKFDSVTTDIIVAINRGLENVMISELFKKIVLRYLSYNYNAIVNEGQTLIPSLWLSK